MSSNSTTALPAHNLVDMQLDSDGFVHGTPADWKTVLVRPEPCQVTVERYARLTQIGEVYVPFAHFVPHEFQRVKNEAHVQSIADSILGGTDLIRYNPVFAVAETVPVAKERHDETHFINADGSPTTCVLLCGNHRVNSLEVISHTKDDPTIGWLTRVHHPSFLQVLHKDHIRRFIHADNYVPDSLLAQRPGSVLSMFKGGLEAFNQAWNSDSLAEIDREVPRLALFAGSLSRHVNGKWKLALRMLGRHRLLIGILHRLFGIPGTFAHIRDDHLVTFLWNIATLGVGLEMTTYIALIHLHHAQNALNFHYLDDPLHPFGFHLDTFLHGATENPNSEQSARLIAAQRSGDWEDIFSEFTNLKGWIGGGELRYPKIDKMVKVVPLPTPLSAFAASARHAEGYIIKYYGMARLPVRLLFLSLYGPNGVLESTDPHLGTLLVKPNQVSGLTQYNVEKLLNSWLMKYTTILDGVRPAKHASELRTRVSQLFNSMRRNHVAFEISDELWDALTTATNGVLGKGGEPIQRNKNYTFPPDQYPAVAGFVNRLLAHPVWYDFLVDDLGFPIGKPFPWAPSVIISELTPNQVAMKHLATHVVHQLDDRRESVSRAVQKAQARLVEAQQSETLAASHLNNVREEQEASLRKELERMENLEQRRLQKTALLKVEMEEQASNAVEAATDAVEAASKIAEAAELRLQERESFLDLLPSAVDPKKLTREQLITLLEEHDLEDPPPLEYDAGSQPRVLEPVVPIPCATQGATATDHSTIVRQLLIEAASSLAPAACAKLSRAILHVNATEAQSLLTSVLTELTGAGILEPSSSPIAAQTPRTSPIRNFSSPPHPASPGRSRSRSHSQRSITPDSPAGKRMRTAQSSPRGLSVLRSVPPAMPPSSGSRQSRSRSVHPVGSVSVAPPPYNSQEASTNVVSQPARSAEALAPSAEVLPASRQIPLSPTQRDSDKANSKPAPRSHHSHQMDVDKTPRAHRVRTSYTGEGMDVFGPLIPLPGADRDPEEDSLWAAIQPPKSQD
ncbi:hypothetical protein B0H15DRAFT_807646 [Mycena belliarum]|uniref:Uncharacterized protein n=1 Tax=Mycena belliarum TaxID=1033014 RepID=A0AAD6TKI9_9AGAR|nr:hypothetical protein B0H15DRAFT_807646 [Mycena belliae]